METIKNYLETMFANMPNTESVRKAKAELLQMMEDKYNELIESGHTENAAVGEVIADFGNLDELADILNLKEEIKIVTQERTERPRRFVYLDEVKDYLHDSAYYAIMLSIGIFLCIASLAPVIVCEQFHCPDWVAISAMFVMAGVGVGLFIYRNMMLKKWNFLKGQLCQTDIATSQYVADLKQNYSSTHAIRLTIGIILCALCWLPAAVLDEFKGIGDIPAAILFILVGIGVFMIVTTNIIMGSYDHILALNDVKTVAGNYVEALKPIYINEEIAVLMEIYWPTVTCIYLAWSFLSFAFWKTWIVWPIAGIIYAVLRANLTKKN